MGGKKGRSKDERRAAKLARGKGGSGDGGAENNNDGGGHNSGGDNDDGESSPPSAGGVGSSQPLGADEFEEDEDDMEWSVDTSEEVSPLNTLQYPRTVDS